MNPKQVLDQSQQQKKYPIKMVHQHKQTAINSGYRRNPDGTAVDDPPGSPGKFNDVWVFNLSQEQYHASMGYAPEGTGDIEAYRREVCGLEQDAVDTNYPRAMYKVTASGELDAFVANDASEQKKLEANGWATTIDGARSASTKKVVKLAESNEEKTEPKKKKRDPQAELARREKISNAMKAKHAAKKAEG